MSSGRDPSHQLWARDSAFRGAAACSPGKAGVSRSKTSEVARCSSVKRRFNPLAGMRKCFAKLSAKRSRLGTSFFSLKKPDLGSITAGCPLPRGEPIVKQKTFFSLLALCACFSLGSAAAQTSPFQFLEKPGRYPVGLKVVNQYDHSRTFPSSSRVSKNSSVGDSPRPLQTLIWYPSAESNEKPMSVGDYAHLADREISPDARSQSNRWNSLLAASSSVVLWAVADAPLAEGRFPSSSMHQATLRYHGKMLISVSISPVTAMWSWQVHRWAHPAAT